MMQADLQSHLLESGRIYVYAECPICKSAGVIDNGRCEDCLGTGHVGGFIPLADIFEAIHMQGGPRTAAQPEEPGGLIVPCELPGYIAQAIAERFGDEFGEGRAPGILPEVRDDLRVWPKPKKRLRFEWRRVFRFRAANPWGRGDDVNLTIKLPWLVRR